LPVEPGLGEILTFGRNLMQALGQTADWFRRALAVEPVKGNLRLSGYSACGQDGGVQLPREYVEGMIHLLIPFTGNIVLNKMHGQSSNCLAHHILRGSL
jgi:hypothetical protein